MANSAGFLLLRRMSPFILLIKAAVARALLTTWGLPEFLLLYTGDEFAPACAIGSHENFSIAIAAPISASIRR